MKKNNVPIPKDFNVSFFKKVLQIQFQEQVKKFLVSTAKQQVVLRDFFKKTKRGATGLYDDTTGGVGNFSLTYGETQGILVSVS